MPCVLSVPGRRLRRKTWLGFVVVDVEPAGSHDGIFVPCAPDIISYVTEEGLDPECLSSNKSVYLITLPALKRVQGAQALPGLQCPSNWQHADVARVILDIFQRPAHTRNNAGWGSSVGLVVFAVFRERHAPRAGEAVGPYHWHIALKASRSFRFAAYKRALAVNHGVASHWSCSHTGYWSAVRYCFIPSPKKPIDELDQAPLTWAADGCHPLLFDCSQEPSTAMALQRRRESQVIQSCADGKKEPRPTEVDLYPIIVKNNFRNTHDDQSAGEKLVRWLKAHATPALFAWAFKNRQKLPGIVDDVWSWETVDDYLELNARTRLELLQRAAKLPCGCGGDWFRAASTSLKNNGINVRDLCSSVLRSLQCGRREDVPVIVFMGRFGGEGKSFFFSPLKNVFGEENVQATPQTGSFPLLGLEKKKVVLLDEWTFDASVLPLPTQLLWYEGKAFPLTRPQNKDYSGHLLYKGSAPIFATCKEKDLGPILAKAQEALALGRPSEHSMLLRRLRIYSFTKRFVAGPHIYECPRCFARIILENGSS